MSSTDAIERVHEAVLGSAAEHGLRGQTAFVGCSGGVDSTVLLTALSALQRELGLGLVAAYFDHGIRPERERERDRELVRKTTAALDVSLVEGGAVPGELGGSASSAGASLEELARAARYRFWMRSMAEQGAQLLVLGHHGDDQAETVLMRLLHGSSLGGLGGMRELSSLSPPEEMRSLNPLRPGELAGDAVPGEPERRVSGEFRVWRPFLSLRKHDLEQYAALQGVAFAEDSTNREIDSLRNRVRRFLLPPLNSVTERGVSNIGVAAEKLREAEEALWAVAGEWCPWHEAHGELRLSREAFELAPAAVRRKALYQGVERIRSHGAPVDAEIPSRFFNKLLYAGRLPHEETLVRGYGLSVVHRGAELVMSPDIVRAAENGYCIIVLPEGIGADRALVLDLAFRKRAGAGERGQSLGEPGVRVALSRVAPPLVVRSPRAGDTWNKGTANTGTPGGTGTAGGTGNPGDSDTPGGTALSELIAEARVPRYLRALVPVVEDRTGIRAVAASLCGGTDAGPVAPAPAATEAADAAQAVTAPAGGAPGHTAAEVRYVSVSIERDLVAGRVVNERQREEERARMSDEGE